MSKSSKTYIGFKARGLGFASAHVTMLYLGKQKNPQSIVNKLEKEFNNVSVKCRRGPIAMFGPNQDIPVLTLIPDLKLWGIRRQLEAMYPFYNKTYGFNPHITLEMDTPSNICLPYTVELNYLDFYS